jgi:hypothetical protein
MDEELTKIMGEVLKNILKEINNSLVNHDFENYKYWSSEWIKFFTPGNLNNLNEIAKKLK